MPKFQGVFHFCVGRTLTVNEFEELVENVEDLAAVAERRNEETISHEDLIKELKENGLL